VSYILPNQNVYDWTDMMLYFLVERHKSCYHLLQSQQYDAIGVNYHTRYLTNISQSASTPRVFDEKTTPTHFEGNFWWTTGAYLTSIPSLGMHFKSFLLF
jgi:hypothetical protein